MDKLFILAIALLPFENLFFAPSAGWASVSPIILFFYTVINYKYLSKSLNNYGKMFFFLFIFAIPISIINYFSQEMTLITNIINSSISLLLGLTTLLAFDIYFIQKKKKISNIVKLLISVYIISIIIGMLQFIVIKFDIELLKKIFKIISKRSYIYSGRVQFTFTEPSYIGMHLFGILLPIYFVLKNKKILLLIVVYTCFGLLFSGSVKLILDILIVLMIVAIIKNINKPKTIIIIIICIPICFGVINALYNTNTRIQQIIDKGIYADGSLASRFFRINAAVKGYSESPFNFLFGYGLGNSIIPMKVGYKEAYKEYDNSWTTEVDLIGRSDYSSDAQSLCFYTKFISDFGFIALVLFLYWIFKLRKKCSNGDVRNYIWILLYLYIQFESYAFYTLWLYVVFLKLYTVKSKDELNILE